MVLKGFLKAEVYEKLNADPRGIRPRDPIANIVFGTVIFPLTPVLKKAINGWFKRSYGIDTPIVLSGASRDWIAEQIMSGWRSVPDAVAFRLDGVRFDRHVRRPAIKWTHKVYHAVRGVHRDVLRFMSARERRERNVFSCLDGRVSFETEPTRTSGDDDTWLGNTLIACRMLDWMCGKLVESGCRKMYVADTSDDLMLVVPSSFASVARQIVEASAREFGFSFEVEVETRRIEDVRWSQSFVVSDGSVCRLIRDIPRTLKRAFVTDQPINDPVVRDSWLCAVGIGGLCDFGDVPVLRALFRRFLELSKGALPMALRSWDGESGTQVHRMVSAELSLNNRRPKVTQMKERLQRFLKMYREPSEEMWTSVTLTYGCSRHHLETVEAELLVLEVDGLLEVDYAQHLCGRKLYM